MMLHNKPRKQEAFFQDSQKDDILVHQSQQ